MTLPSILKHGIYHNIIPLKGYSQNFILHSNLCDKIVKISDIDSTKDVLEIGPGIGGLTRSILNNNPKTLTVLELDIRCIPLLKEIQILYNQLHIIHIDACKFDLSTLFSKKIIIISNLPYQIGVKLITLWFKNISLIQQMILMLQKEVVDRICASVNTKTYSRLSVICQLLFCVKKCFDVSYKSFYPRPKVMSSIIRFTPLQEYISPLLVDAVQFITKSAFHSRRKMVKNTLKLILPNIEHYMLDLNIDSFSRAENLSPQDYLNLAKLYLNLNIK